VDRGCTADLLRLEDAGVTGNGHGLIFEANNGQTLAAVTAWMADQGS
jgi:hypothetical protein